MDRKRENISIGWTTQSIFNGWLMEFYWSDDTALPKVNDIALPNRSDTVVQPDWSDDTATGKGIRIRILWEFIHGKILGDFGPVLQLGTASEEGPRAGLMSWLGPYIKTQRREILSWIAILRRGQRWVTAKNYLDGFLDSNF